MRKVTIVTDGVNDLPKELIEKYDISVIPYRVIFGDDIYQVWNNDETTIPREEFLRRLTNSPKDALPHTSVPPYSEFISVFEDALKKAKSVIAIFISSKLSGTVQSASSIANSYFPDNDITIFDSKQTMAGTGIQVLEAAKLAHEGKTKREILNFLRRINPRVRTIFSTNDIDYLHRQGRIGRARKLLMTSFNMIPIIFLKKGLVNSVGTFHSKEKEFEQMMKYSLISLRRCKTNNIFLSYVGNKEVAQEIFNTMNSANTKGVKIHFYEASPILSIYTGPNALSLSYIGFWRKRWILRKNPLPKRMMRVNQS